MALRFSGPFNREILLSRLESTDAWDVVVIGGGATGLGIAIDAASRGYSTLLAEQHDFAKGTSSRSTKLVHGGVRYLAQGDVKLVYSALRERGILLKNAAHLVRKQAFVIPCFSAWERMKYLTGLKLYDLLAGRHSFGRSVYIGKKELLRQQSAISKSNLLGGVVYFDGQFDDARLAVNMAQTAIEQGALVMNYLAVTKLLKENGKVTGVMLKDGETNRQYPVRAKTVINATGVFVDEVLRMDDPQAKPLVRPSQGVHVVVGKKFLNGRPAIMIPKTADGRVLFALPWHEHVVIGTTDTPVARYSLEPVALDREVAFILNTVKAYLDPAPGEDDVLSVFAGLRPLAASTGNQQSTKEISRDHKLLISPSGLVTITGGKWTTYRKMAEETVSFAAVAAGLAKKPCRTPGIALHGNKAGGAGRLSDYGSDEPGIHELIEKDPSLAARIVGGHEFTEAEVVWAVQQEMARTVEDVLARRLRLLFLDAQAAIDASQTVADIVAAELGHDRNWALGQVQEFKKVAKAYLLNKETT